MNNFDIYPEATAKQFEIHDRMVIEKGRPIELEEVVETPIGKKYFITAKFPLKDQQGRIYAMGGVATDITAQKKAEQKTQKLNQWLQDMNKDLSDFSYSISHDLKTPLRAIEGFSNILAERLAQKLEAEDKRLLKVICDNVRRMSQLIDDLLSFARTARIELAPRMINTLDLAENIIAELKGRAIGRDISFKLGDLPPIYADMALMQQALFCLLDNAVKFTSAREKAVIETGCRIEKDRNVFYVKDNGIGFNPAYSGKLFKIFQRLQTEYPGTGVGLALAKKIITRHGGEIWAEGAPDNGACVYFTLPPEPQMNTKEIE